MTSRARVSSPDCRSKAALSRRVRFRLLRCCRSVRQGGAIALGAACLATAAFADDTRLVKAQRLETALNAVEQVRIPLGAFSHSGGALDAWGDDLLVATPEGFLVVAKGGADRTRTQIDLALLPAGVPMNLARLRETPFARDPSFTSAFFRVADILLEPQPDGSALLYVSHHVASGSCIEVAVSRARLTRDTPEALPGVGAWERVFTATPCVAPKPQGHPFAGHQVGGKMVRHAGGELWLALGDHEYDGTGGGFAAPMLDAVDFGKVIAIDTDTGAHRIVARGLRNPQGLVAAADGRVWETEHGPRGGDEVNLIEEGNNYGWPEVTLGVGYGGPWQSNPVQGRHDGYVVPRFAWVPSIAVSAIAEAEAAEFPLWAGDLLVATLSDKALHRLRLEGDRVVYAERALPLDARLRDLVTLPDGRLALLSDGARIILLSRASVAPAGPLTISGGALLAEQMKARRAAAGLAEAYSGGAIFSRACGACHRLDGEADVGPPLANIIGQEIGATAGFGYSRALASAKGIWSPEALLRYLSDPAAEFPGTTMPPPDLSLAEVRTLLRWLEAEAKRDGP